METERLAEQVNLAARLLAEYGDRTALFEDSALRGYAARRCAGSFTRCRWHASS